MWGCEFVDDGGYGSAPPPAAIYLELPTQFVLSLADRNHLSNVRMTHDLSHLEASVHRNGIMTPCQIEFWQGRVRLKEGHHRLAVALKLGLEKMPVVLVEVDRLNTGTRILPPEMAHLVPRWMRLLGHL